MHDKEFRCIPAVPLNYYLGYFCHYTCHYMLIYVIVIFLLLVEYTLENCKVDVCCVHCCDPGSTPSNNNDTEENHCYRFQGYHALKCLS